MSKRILLTCLMLSGWLVLLAGKSTEQNLRTANTSQSTTISKSQLHTAPAWADAADNLFFPSSTSTPKKPSLTKAPFDVALQFPFATTGATASLTGIAWTGTEFWVSKWNSDTLRTYDVTGALTSVFSVPGVTGTRSLTWDGTSIFAGGAGNAIREINPTTKTLVSTISLAGTPVGARMCAYDPNADNGNGGFWIGNFTSAIQLYSRTGTLLTSIPQTTSNFPGIYGGAVDTFTAGGPYLLVYYQGGISNNTIGWIDIATGTPLSDTYNVNDDVPVAGIAGGLFVADGIIPGQQHILTITQNAAGTMTAYEAGLPPPPASPANDDLCNAEEYILGGGSIQGDNALATIETGEIGGACFDTPADATVWYFFVAADTGYVVTTDLIVGTNDDTQLAAYLSSGGCNGTLTEIACNEDKDFAGGNFLAEMTVSNLTAGDTVWIQVDGWQTTQGTFNLLITPNVPASISRDFEAYNSGDAISTFDSEWALWPAAGVTDAFVTDVQSQSGTKSLAFDGVANAIEDPIYLLGDQTSGTWGVGFSMFVPNGSSAYYNIQETQSTGVNWVIGNVNLNANGTGVIDGYSTPVNFIYPQGQWFDVRHYIDLDNDSLQIFIDGGFVVASAYTEAAGGATQLGALNFYSPGATGAVKTYYLDDMYFQADSLRTIPTISFTSFDLGSPASGARVATDNANPTTPVVIDWNATTVSSGAAVSYEWLLDLPGGDFSAPLRTLDSDNSGADTTLSLTLGGIDVLLNGLGVNPGDSVDVIWTVRATSGQNTELAANGPFDIRFVRDQASGLSNSEFASVVSMYPNPTEGILTVTDSRNIVENISILNLVGSEVLRFENVEKVSQYDLTSLSNGVYLVNFVTRDGNYTQKLIIE